jgi:hypothetical protein
LEVPTIYKAYVIPIAWGNHKENALGEKGWGQGLWFSRKGGGSSDHLFCAIYLYLYEEK